MNWMSEREFVIVWAIPAFGDMDAWLMVRHVERGWELPGGAIRKGEAVDEVALRELFEETGKLGIAKAIDNDLMKEQDSRMPINVERQSRVTFGGTKKS